MLADSSKREKGQGLTAYRSQITLVNASTLNDGLRKRVRRKNSKVLKDIASEGVVGVFPK